MRRAGSATILLGVLALASCGSSRSGYLITDPVMLSVIGGPPAVSRMQALARRRLGVELTSVTARDEKAAQAAIGQALADVGCRLVVGLWATPMDVEELASGRPDVLFALYGERGIERPANVLLLLPTRDAAFREAGRRIGALAGLTGDAGPGSGVGILAAGPSGGAEKEIAAFREGLASAAPGTQALYRDLRTSTDRAGATRLLKELRSEGVGYFLLKTYGLTTHCLEDLARDGGRAIVEDCGGSLSCGAEVLLSVETDWIATFAAILELAAPGETGPWAWKGSELAESWRLDDHSTAGNGG